MCYHGSHNGGDTMIRYIQAAITQEDFSALALCACEENLTKSEIIEKAVKQYIKLKREGGASVKTKTRRGGE